MMILLWEVNIINNIKVFSFLLMLYTNKLGCFLLESIFGLFRISRRATQEKVYSLSIATLIKMTLFQHSPHIDTYRKRKNVLLSVDLLSVITLNVAILNVVMLY